MSSLESCIRKAGKALSKKDAKAIRAIRDDILKGKIEPKILVEDEHTFDNINQQAVDEYLEILQGEKDFIMRQVEAAGGVVADTSLSPSEFAKQAAKNVDEAAKVFPQKGIYRPPAETAPIDYKTGEPIPEGMVGQGLDPNLTRELLTERSAKTVEMLYPDFYSLPPGDVLAIVKTFDEKAAAGLEGQTENPEFHAWAGAVIANWIQKNETLPLRYKVEDPFDRNLVDAHPEHPLSVVSKYEQVLREAEEAEAQPVRSIMNKLVDTKELGRGPALALLPQTKLPDMMKFGMEDVKNYTRTVKKMDAWMNRVIENHHALAKEWLKFNQRPSTRKGARLLGEFMHASTLSGVDVPTFEMPDAATFKKMNQGKRAMWLKRKQDYAALLPFWEKLGKMGDRVTYQRSVYDPAVDRYKETGTPMDVSQGQKIYLDVRDTYSNMRSMLIFNLEKRINETEADGNAKAALIALLRKQFEAGEINPYFPLTRFGKYAAVAKTKEGETIAYIKKENRRERNDWLKEMRSKGFVVTPFEERASDIEQMSKIDPEFVARVTDLLEDSTVRTQDGATIAGSAISDQIWQMYLRTLPEMSARKSYIHRIGRLGFTHDALRAFSDHTFHGTHQTAKLRYGHEMSEYLRDVEGNAELLMQRADHIRNWEKGIRPKGFEDTTFHEILFARIPEYAELYSKYKREAGVAGAAMHEDSHQKALQKTMKEAEIDGPWAVPLSEELKRRHEYNMNPKSAAWSTKMTALGFLWFLSTSPAAGFLNLTQTAISAYPILRARFRGDHAGVELLRASKEFATQRWVGLQPSAVQNFITKLSGDEKRAVQEFSDIGMFSKTRTRELLGLSEAGTAYSTFQEQVLEFTGYIFHKTEEMNRVVTALAAYRLARKKGMSHADAVMQADELVEMSHYDYTNTNRPRFMQGDKGRVVFLFRNYSLNMSYRLIRDFRDGVWTNKNIPIEARKEARSRFLGIIGMSSIFVGISGWPMIWAVEAIANNLLGDEDDPFDSKTQTRKLVYEATEKYIAEGWGEAVATAVMKGPWSAITGADLSTRASLNNLWIREVPDRLWDDPKALLTHLVGEALGPMMGMGMNFFAGIGDVQSGHPERAIEKFMPKFVGDIAKTIRFATQGAQTYQRDMIMSPEEFTTPSLFLQAMGFAPTALTDRYDQNRAIKDMEMKLRNRRQDLMNKLFLSWKLKDREAARDVLKEIAEWNKKNPRYPITPDGIKQSARSRARYDERTVGGVAVEKRLQYLLEEQRFTDRPKR